MGLHSPSLINSLIQSMPPTRACQVAKHSAGSAWGSTGCVPFPSWRYTLKYQPTMSISFSSLVFPNGPPLSAPASLIAGPCYRSLMFNDGENCVADTKDGARMNRKRRTGCRGRTRGHRTNVAMSPRPVCCPPVTVQRCTTLCRSGG